MLLSSLGRWVAEECGEKKWEWQDKQVRRLTLFRFSFVKRENVYIYFNILSQVIKPLFKDSFLNLHIQ